MQVDPTEVVELVKQHPTGELLVRNAVQQIIIGQQQEALQQLQDQLARKQAGDEAASEEIDDNPG